MRIPNINFANATLKGKKIGTAAGFGAGSAYIISTARDNFVKSAREAAVKLGSRNKGILIASGVAVGIIATTTALGRLIGTGIGKLVDKHNAKKASKANEIV